MIKLILTAILILNTHVIHVIEFDFETYLRFTIEYKLKLSLSVSLS